MNLTRIYFLSILLLCCEFVLIFAEEDQVKKKEIQQSKPNSRPDVGMFPLKLLFFPLFFPVQQFARVWSAPSLLAVVWFKNIKKSNA